LIGEDVVVAGFDPGARGGDRDIEERGRVGIACVAPIEAGVGDDDFDAGDEEGEDTEGGDPVSKADEEGVAGRAGGGRGDGGVDGPSGIGHR
jgi:hypothetical protein